MKQEIIKNSYIRIPEFISRNEALLLGDEFKGYATANCGGDSQASNAHCQYDYLPFVRLLVKKVPEVGMLLGEDVLPTYAYSRIYKTGSVLERHRDRPACEVSLTLNLSKSHDWPIYFQRPDGSESHIELEPGDAVLYLGCIADHWREQFIGEEYTQVFLHYVRAGGENAWAYFDKERNSNIVQIPKVEIKNKEWRATVL